MRAELALNEIFKGKPPSPDVLAENFEHEVSKLKLKVCRIEDESSPHQFLAGVQTHVVSGCGVEIGQSCPNARQDQFLLWGHVPSILRSVIWSSPTVSLRPHVARHLSTHLSDTSTFHIHCSYLSSSLIDSTSTRSCNGITSYLIYATMSTLSTLYSYGFFPNLPLSSLHVTVLAMGQLQALSSHGGIALSFMIQTK
jgi:hypothetical protein